MLQEEAKEPMVAATPKALMATAEAAEVEVEAAGLDSLPAASAVGSCLLWFSAFSAGPYLKIRGILAAPEAMILAVVEAEEVRAGQVS
jgi:hypothetical protein